MRAAVFRATGPAREVLSVEDIASPEPAAGEVCVRIALSAVNPTDWKERSHGTTLGDLPFKVPNQDGVGVIEAVGEGIDPARVGQRVWLYFAARNRQHGTAAERCTLPAEHAVPLPDRASDELGASMGVPAITAHRCLFADGPVDGRTVLVSGGAGAVGHFAIELARWRGARVITTVSSEEKARLARAAGAHEVVDYRTEDAAARIRELAPDGVDRVVEVALHQNIGLDAAVCGDDAAIAAYANGGETRFAVSDLMRRNIVVRAVLIYTMPREALREAIRDVTGALEAGVLSELPSHRFVLDQIADAHDAVEAGAVGKVLVDVAA